MKNFNLSYSGVLLFVLTGLVTVSCTKLPEAPLTGASQTQSLQSGGSDTGPGNIYGGGTTSTSTTSTTTTSTTSTTSTTTTSTTTTTTQTQGGGNVSCQLYVKDPASLTPLAPTGPLTINMHTTDFSNLNAIPTPNGSYVSSWTSFSSDQIGTGAVTAPTAAETTGAAIARVQFTAAGTYKRELQINVNGTMVKCAGQVTYVVTASTGLPTLNVQVVANPTANPPNYLVTAAGSSGVPTALTFSACSAGAPTLTATGTNGTFNATPVSATAFTCTVNATGFQPATGVSFPAVAGANQSFKINDSSNGAGVADGIVTLGYSNDINAAGDGTYYIVAYGSYAGQVSRGTVTCGNSVFQFGAAHLNDAAARTQANLTFKALPAEVASFSNAVGSTCSLIVGDVAASPPAKFVLKAAINGVQVITNAGGTGIVLYGALGTRADAKYSCANAHSDYAAVNANNNTVFYNRDGQLNFSVNAANINQGETCQLWFVDQSTGWNEIGPINFVPKP